MSEMRDKLIALLGQHGFNGSNDDVSKNMLGRCVYFFVPEKRMSSYGYFFVEEGLPDYYYELAYEFLLQWPIFRMRSVRIFPSPIMPDTAKVKVKLLYRGTILTTGMNITHDALEAQEKFEAPDLIWMWVKSFFDMKMGNTRKLPPTIRCFPDEKDGSNPLMRPEVVLGEADDQ